MPRPLRRALVLVLYIAILTCFENVGSVSVTEASDAIVGSLSAIKRVSIGVFAVDVDRHGSGQNSRLISSIKLAFQFDRGVHFVSGSKRRAALALIAVGFGIKRPCQREWRKLNPTPNNEIIGWRRARILERQCRVKPSGIQRIGNADALNKPYVSPQLSPCGIVRASDQITSNPPQEQSCRCGEGDEQIAPMIGSPSKPTWDERVEAGKAFWIAVCVGLAFAAAYRYTDPKR